MVIDARCPAHELEYHERVFGKDIAEERVHWEPRTRADMPLDPLIVPFLPVSERVSILDVGAGPLTQVGFKHPGKIIDVTPIDPLADAYLGILTRAGVVAPVPTRYGLGENLLVDFTENTFDIAYSRNALDHAMDPLAVLWLMLRVTKRGGTVLIYTTTDAGIWNRYNGFHRWNFRLVGNDVEILSMEGHLTSILSEFGNVAKLEIAQYPASGDPQKCFAFALRKAS